MRGTRNKEVEREREREREGDADARRNVTCATNVVR
jgi:hypothetical protein